MNLRWLVTGIVTAELAAASGALATSMFNPAFRLFFGANAGILAMVGLISLLHALDR